MLNAIWLFMCLSLDIMLFPWFLPACCIIMLLLDIMLSKPFIWRLFIAILLLLMEDTIWLFIWML